ncbi:hypothetical protein [Thalassospira lucentensis]|uniref:hypothetical protein n=1 Tax=Thalassospira lucentensis TaxID=168935 RepID=UPI003D265C78
MITKQFGTVINFAVFIAIKGKKCVIAADPCGLIDCAIAINVKLLTVLQTGDVDAIAVKVKDKRVLLKGLCDVDGVFKDGVLKVVWSNIQRLLPEGLGMPTYAASRTID